MKCLNFKTVFQVLLLLASGGGAVYLEAFSIGSWPKLVQSIASIVQVGLMVVMFNLLLGIRSSEKSITKPNSRPSQSKATPRKIPRLLTFLLSFDKEHETMIGDLIETANEFSSILSGHLWLYKQVLKSIVPLICKAVKNRLAAYFGERVR
jgi:hypothetical protein